MSRKYDLWYKEFVSKFVSLLSTKAHELHATLSSTRNKLEVLSFDGISSTDVVNAFEHILETEHVVGRRCDRCCAVHVVVAVVVVAAVDVSCRFVSLA